VFLVEALRWFWPDDDAWTWLLAGPAHMTSPEGAAPAPDVRRADAPDLIASVDALATFARHHGPTAAEALLMELLNELLERPKAAPPQA
jgi:hypothetical protein